MNFTKQLSVSITGFGRRLLKCVLPEWNYWPLKPNRQRHIRRLLHFPNSSLSNLRVLFWEPGGVTGLLDISAVIATALRLRGAAVHLTMCDGAASGCMQRLKSDGIPIRNWPKRCPGCAQNYRSEVESFALPFSSLGDFVPTSRRIELRKLAYSVPAGEIFCFQYEGVDVGRFAASSVARYLMGKAMGGEVKLLREYLYSSLVCTEAAKAAIDRFQPNRLFMSQPFYTDWAPALSIAINRGIPVIILLSGYWPGHFYFNTCSLNKIDVGDISSELWEKRQAKPLSNIESGRLDSFFKLRYSTSKTADIPLSSMLLPKDELAQQLRLPRGRPVWCLFTHVNWDAVFDYGKMAFEIVNDWVIETIRAMESNRDVTWLIKIHPVEFKDKQRYGVYQLILEHFPKLPEHIRLIHPTLPVNTYGLFSILDGGVTVFGTVGLELAASGKPVILAGAPYYGGRGFTYDCKSKEEYLNLLSRANHLPHQSVCELERARQFAYIHFIQRQIPLNVFTDDERGAMTLIDNRLEQLMPGRDLAMDTICTRIMDNGDFIFPGSDNPRPLEKPFQDWKPGITK
jgi:hypothetical protein